MKPSPEFAALNMEFWANVRLISQNAGYTKRGTHTVVAHDAEAMARAVERSGLDPSYLFHAVQGQPSLSSQLERYFAYRAEVLNAVVEPSLMSADTARAAYEGLRTKLGPSCPIPMNKQKEEKRAPSYFTGIINMLIEANCAGYPVAYDPRRLTVFTDGGRPLRTLARRVDGCFPATVDPIAVWETKEYYYTTTSGSRVAGAIYETILDGTELRELADGKGRHVRHYLMVDGHYTWWECGRWCLCRIVDMVHMGYVDEVLFGRQVVSDLPALVQEWVEQARNAGKPPVSARPRRSPAPGSSTRS